MGALLGSGLFVGSALGAAVCSDTGCRVCTTGEGALKLTLLRASPTPTRISNIAASAIAERFSARLSCIVRAGFTGAGALSAAFACGFGVSCFGAGFSCFGFGAGLGSGFFSGFGSGAGEAAGMRFISSGSSPQYSHSALSIAYGSSYRRSGSKASAHFKISRSFSDTPSGIGKLSPLMRRRRACARFSALCSPVWANGSLPPFKPAYMISAIE